MRVTRILSAWLYRCFGLILFLFLGAANVANADVPASGEARESKLTKLRLQLQWDHQAQFAGFYVAQSRKYFAEEGLEVEIIPGGPGINPITEVQEGRADIAVSWLSNAWRHTTPQQSVTNIAQIFANSSLLILCRSSAGIYSAKDFIGKKVGVWNLGDELVVEEWMRRFKVPRDKVELIEQRSGGIDLIEGKVACATAMDYNEYWKIINAGVDPSDIIVIADKKSVPHIEDGLYVLTERLDSESFRHALIHFLRASRQGWDLVNFSPTLAIETLSRIKPDINREQQRHMLENVLNDIHYDKEKFGLLNLKEYEAAVSRTLINGAIKIEPAMLWTHEIWNSMRQEDGVNSPITSATKHYVSRVFHSKYFGLFFAIGILTFALSGVLEAINRGYDLWGRLVLAFVSGLGGGALRDILIGGDRYPLSFTRDITLPLGILIIVLVSLIVTMFNRNLHNSKIFKKVKLFADIIGFAVLATAGAMIAIVANLHWLWAPICAALSCAGGGMLRDIVINNEPATFKGVFYEEI
ncbi:ABC transporter substrate-binding protein, partial [Zwartia sp.]|uniref:ABC transporter substrate-binding protein n=1 Tax=Zwartia sp. TaxID=2978004 RepID=UPI00271CE199